MARLFTAASSHRVNLSAGATLVTAAYTLAAVFRRASNSGATSWPMIYCHTDSGNVGRLALEVTSTTSGIGDDIFACSSDTPNDETGYTGAGGAVLSTDGWVFGGHTRTAGANQTPRAHIYRYATNAWTQADHNAQAGSGGRSDPPSLSGGNAVIGAFRNGASSYSDFWDGDIAWIGVWNRALSDAEMQLLPWSLAAVLASAPLELFVLDQAATAQKIRSLTGSGSAESAINGTAVSSGSVPIFGYGVPILRVTRNAGATEITLTPATETDSAQALSLQYVKALGQASETDSAIAASAQKQASITLATETDAAVALGLQFNKTLGPTTESDASQGLSIQRVATLTHAAETDVAVALSTTSGSSYTLTPAVETDAAQGLAAQKTVGLDQALESDAAQGVTRQKQVTLTQAAEADQAQALSFSGPKTLTPAAESDTAIPLALSFFRALTPATESSVAQALARQKIASLTHGEESDQAQPLSLVWHRALGSALEADAAVALVIQWAGTVLPMVSIAGHDGPAVLSGGFDYRVAQDDGEDGGAVNISGKELA